MTTTTTTTTAATTAAATTTADTASSLRPPTCLPSVWSSRTRGFEEFKLPWRLTAPGWDWRVLASCRPEAGATLAVRECRSPKGTDLSNPLCLVLLLVWSVFKDGKRHVPSLVQSMKVSGPLDQ